VYLGPYNEHLLTSSFDEAIKYAKEHENDEDGASIWIFVDGRIRGNSDFAGPDFDKWVEEVREFCFKIDTEK
jgi:hypothetical protein